MDKISVDLIRQKGKIKVGSNGVYAICDLPISISSLCPYCHERVVFKCHEWSGITQQILSSSSECASCQKKVIFSALGIINVGDYWQPEDVYIYPSPLQKRSIVADIDNEMPESLKRAYRGAVDAYNAGLWNPAVVAARRVLEGITKTNLPEEAQRQTLYKQVEALSKHVDLAQPIKQIGHSLRNAGNLGAHFDLEREADAGIAAIMFDLLDYLVEYIYAIPNRVKLLEERIEQEEKSTDQQ